MSLDHLPLVCVGWTITYAHMPATVGAGTYKQFKNEKAQRDKMGCVRCGEPLDKSDWNYWKCVNEDCDYYMLDGRED